MQNRGDKYDAGRRAVVGVKLARGGTWVIGDGYNTAEILGKSWLVSFVATKPSCEFYQKISFVSSIVSCV